jgi:hypothetical protein
MTLSLGCVTCNPPGGACAPDDPMTYGYQIVDLVEIYQNINKKSYFLCHTSAILGVEKWSIYEPKVISKKKGGVLLIIKF